MHPYQAKCIIKKANPESPLEIDQLDWVWPEADRGGWDIPKHEWEESHKETWFKHIKKYDIAVQAGGCCGMYPRLLGKMFQVVYTFEPSPLNFYCLTANCQEDNIVKMQCALGRKAETVALAIRSDNVGMNKINKSIGLGYYPVITLDSLNLPGCDLLALDVEEDEFNILYGAKQTILKYNPVVILENGHYDDIKEMMKELDYMYAATSKLDTIYIQKEIYKKGDWNGTPVSG